MQHNNWGRDRDLLAEAVGKVFSEQHDPELEDLARDAMAPDPTEEPPRGVEYSDDYIDEDIDKGNIYEGIKKLNARLGALMEHNPKAIMAIRELRNGFSELLNDLEVITTDIYDSIDADGMVDAATLGGHLARLAPDTTKGSEL
jgi:hypothetical protein